MIEIKDAIAIIAQNNYLLNETNVATKDVLNQILAKDIHSPLNIPSFNQSAMDGYAICGNGNTFTVVGEIQAGDTNNYQLKDNEAYRIFTGAKTPQNTTAVAKQEIVERDNNTIKILEKIKEGSNIRKEGEEITKGEIALKKGTLLTPAAIGFLATLGIKEVITYRQPNIAIIVTGNELTPVGEELKAGKIYESNSYTLKAALKDSGFASSVITVKDDYSSTKNTIEDAIKNNDLVIITGGISVGDYDYVGKALEDLGVNQVFYKVNQKPGKPLYHGIKDNTKIFALPGNPAAALTCFYIYVLTALKKMTGYVVPSPTLEKAIITHAHYKKGDRGHLLKAHIKNNKVTILTKQSSAMLSSFINANCLVHLPPNQNNIEKGEEVEVYLIP